MYTETKARGSSNIRLESLSIFFPAYNEAENLPTTIQNTLDSVVQITDDFEILVINDGSSDNTTEVVTKISETHPQVHLINHPQNMGYGAALITGFKNATKTWTFFTDGDGQFDVHELAHFIEFTHDYDVIIGYREKRNDPLIRTLNAKGWNYLNRLFFGLHVRDIDCAFKLIKTNAVQEIINQTTSFGAMISAEILIRLKRQGYTFKELPVKHFPRTAGSPTGAKPSVILRAFREMARVYRGDLGPNWAKSVNTFMLIGILNTVTDIALYLLLSRFIPGLIFHLTWSKGLSFSMSLIQSFVLNQVIRLDQQATFIHAIRFMLLGMASLSINTSVMYIAYNTLGLGELIAVVSATSVTFIWNYLATKYLLTKN